MITYRMATRTDVRKVAIAAAESFDEYPIFDLVFRDCFSSKRKYINYMKRLHMVNARALMRRNECLIAEDDKGILALALLENPQAPEVSLSDYIISGGLSLIFPVGLNRLAGFFEISEKMRRDCIINYTGEWYLELLAVRGDVKGTGIGSRFMNECIKPYVRSRKGKELILVTNTERNCCFYAKNGFEIFSEFSLRWGERRIKNWSLHCEL